MRLKEIKPGMVIRCKDDNEKVMLWNWFNENGYVRENEPEEGLRSFLNCKSPYGIYEKSWNTFCDREGAIDFSDLILPELSVEEAMKIISEIHNVHYMVSSVFSCKGCPLENVTNHCAPNMFLGNAKEIIAVCEQWKADHSKKEPELEWVDVCRIIQVHDNSVKKCMHEIVLAVRGTEEDKTLDDWLKRSTENELKKYISKHDGNYIAVIERVCRVKQ